MRVHCGRPWRGRLSVLHPPGRDCRGMLSDVRPALQRTAARACGLLTDREEPNRGFDCEYNPGIDIAQTCYRYYSTGSFPTVQCSSGTSEQFSYLTVPATVTTTASASTGGGSAGTSVISSILVNAPLIQINWQSTDRTTPTATSTSPGSASTTPSSTPTPQSDGLSRGATIGIAVAAAVVGLVLIAAVCTWMRRRRRRYPDVMPTLPPDPNQTKAGTPHEIDSMCVAEAPTEGDAHEIGGMEKRSSCSPRYEMAG